MDEVNSYFDISIGNRDCGRLIFKLFYDKCPKTCENFRCLCTGEKSEPGRTLHFKGSAFHRVVRNFIIQGGDITEGNGRGGDSIYGGSFDDENLELAHDEPYLLSMANRGPNTNRSQFFITTDEAPHLNGKHVVFGKLVSGIDIIHKIERLEVDSKSRPLRKVIIKDCGQLSAKHLGPQSTRDPIKNDKLNAEKSSSTTSNVLRESGKYHKRKGSSAARDPPESSKGSSNSSSPRCSRSRVSKRLPSYSESSCNSGAGHRPESNSSSSGSSISSSGSNSSSSGSDSGSSTNSSTSDGTSSGGSQSRSSRSGSQPGGSSISYSSSCLNSRSRKKQKTNRRLEATRNVEDFKSPVNEARTREGEIDTFVNPHYKCSVMPDEIPEVPVNRFLMRGSTQKQSQDERPNEANKEYQDEIIPIGVDLSRFEDLPDDEGDEVGIVGGEGAAPKRANMLKSQVKATESLISRSGRIMKGRGRFKFRTPSPNDATKSTYRDKGRSYHSPKERRKRRRNVDHSSRYTEKSYRRFSRTRSRSRSRSRSYSLSRSRSRSRSPSSHSRLRSKTRDRNYYRDSRSTHYGHDRIKKDRRHERSAAHYSARRDK